jgi:hypothetical protein
MPTDRVGIDIINTGPCRCWKTPLKSSLWFSSGKQALAFFFFKKETIEQHGLNTDWRYIRPISSNMITMSKISPNPPLG